MLKLFTNVEIYLVIVCMRLNSSYGQSLARNKTVTLSPNNGNNWEKSGAVDGKYDRNASRCKCCADTGSGRDPSVEIDLGGANSFTRIVVYGRTDFSNSANMLDNLEVELDDDPVSVSPTPNSSDPYFLHIDFGQTMSARYIKLISKGTDKRFVLCEVDVFNDSIISTKKTIEASSTFDNWQPSNAVDGLIRTNDPDACLCCAATRTENDPWLKLDLGDTFFVTLIQLYGRTDSVHFEQSFEGMRIDVDDITIHTIPTSGTHIDYYELFPTPDKFGRYIKLTLTGNNRVLILCEVVVYGERVISTKKTARQVSRFEDWYASNAVDGNYVTDNPYGCKCCAATNYEKDPWLEVDLGPNHKISRIVIYGRTDGEFRGRDTQTK